MKAYLLITLMGAAAIAKGQNAEKKVSLSDSTKLVYVVGDDGITKNGVYSITVPKKEAVLVQGNYKNDARVGSWYFFNTQNKLALRYNYDQKKVTYLDTTVFKNVSVELPNAAPEVAKAATAPVPLCSVDYYTSLLSSSVYNFDRNGPMDVAITAHVEVDGSATYTVSYLKNNKKTNERDLKVRDDKFMIDWIPAMYNGKPVYSEFTVYASVSEQQGSVARRTQWNN